MNEEYMGRYFKRDSNKIKRDKTSWEWDKIYIVEDDGTIKFNRSLYVHSCTPSETAQFINDYFTEVGVEEWNKQEEVMNLPLLFN